MARTELYTPTRIDVLRMENDLLTHEVRYLRAKLEGAGRNAVTGQVPADRDLERAYSDLRWFVGRLSRSPAGWVLRRWPGFRTLEARYLRGGS